MGTKPSTSAVDPRGRVWGTEGLYVADAVSRVILSHSALLLTLLPQSVFPTASAVNPMITVRSSSSSARARAHHFVRTQNMSTAHSIAQFIDQDLRSAASKPTSAHL